MDYRTLYEQWLNNQDFDQDFRDELAALTDQSEIEDRFYTELSFGTAGMRGVIGAGRNRINKYNVRKASAGYANYLLQKNANASCVIAYDNRRMSVEFSREAACVFAAMGIKTYLFESLRSTPELSFAIRHLKTTGGVVITASHNPPEYNGYKVYGEDGAQLMPEEADKVSVAVAAVTDFSSIATVDFDGGKQSGMIEVIGDALDQTYLSAVKKQMVHADVYADNLTIAYTPLHGTGGTIIKQLFDQIGAAGMVYQPEQMVPDSEFSTVNKPNPEDAQAFDKVIEYGQTKQAVLLIATDPDADRVGVMVRDQTGAYTALNGNQVGALLTYYLLDNKQPLPNDSAIVKTVVTSDLGPKIAQGYGVASYETLTGFKFIGNIIKGFEAAGKGNFILGYEESYGYLVGNHARDKDAVVTTMLIVEMTKYYARHNLTLLDVLTQIQEKYGFYQEKMLAKVMAGKSGMAQIQTIMAGFREDATTALSRLDIIRVDDFKAGVSKDIKSGATRPLEQPSSNVLKYHLANGSWFAARPSGTEPKIKFYCSAVGSSDDDAQRILNNILEQVENFVDQLVG